MSAAPRIHRGTGRPPPLYRNYPIVVLFAADLVLSALSAHRSSSATCESQLRPARWKPPSRWAGSHRSSPPPCPPAVLARPGSAGPPLPLVAHGLASVGAVVAGPEQQSPSRYLHPHRDLLLHQLFVARASRSRRHHRRDLCRGLPRRRGLPHPWTSCSGGWPSSRGDRLASVPVFELRREAVALDGPVRPPTGSRRP